VHQIQTIKKIILGEKNIFEKVLYK